MITIVILAVLVVTCICGIIDYKQMSKTHKETKSLLTAIGKTQVGIMSDLGNIGTPAPVKLKAAKAPKVDLDPILERIADLETGQGHIVEALNALVDQLNSLPIEAAYIGDDD